MVDREEKLRELIRTCPKEIDECNREILNEYKLEFKGIQEGKKIERAKSIMGKCTICNKPDKFSKSVICSECIKKWKDIQRGKGKKELWGSLEDELDIRHLLLVHSITQDDLDDFEKRHNLK
jgi:hypothetical protein